MQCVDYPDAINALIASLHGVPGDTLMLKIKRYSTALSELNSLVASMEIDADVASLKAFNNAIALINLANMNFLDLAKRSVESGVYESAQALMEQLVEVALKKDMLFQKHHPMYSKG